MSYITQSHYLLRYILCRIAECIESGLDGEGVSAESREFHLERLRETLESCRPAYPTSVYSGSDWRPDSNVGSKRTATTIGVGLEGVSSTIFPGWETSVETLLVRRVRKQPLLI